MNLNIDDAIIKLKLLKDKKKALKVDYYNNKQNYGYEIYDEIEKLNAEIIILNDYILSI